MSVKGKKGGDKGPEKPRVMCRLCTVNPATGEGLCDKCRNAPVFFPGWNLFSTTLTPSSTLKPCGLGFAVTGKPMKKLVYNLNAQCGTLANAKISCTQGALEITGGLFIIELASGDGWNLHLSISFVSGGFTSSTMIKGGGPSCHLCVRNEGKSHQGNVFYTYFDFFFNTSTNLVEFGSRGHAGTACDSQESATTLSTASGAVNIGAWVTGIQAAINALLNGTLVFETATVEGVTVIRLVPNSDKAKKKNRGLELPVVDAILAHYQQVGCPVQRERLQVVESQLHKLGCDYVHQLSGLSASDWNDLVTVHRLPIGAVNVLRSLA